MDDPNKSKLFAFGKIENKEDSDSEESLSDSTDEDPIPKYRVRKDISSKCNENHQDLVKGTERLNFRDTRSEFLKSNSSEASSTANDVYNWRRYDERSLTPDDEMMLPSEVTDKEYIYMPSAAEEIDEEDEDMSNSGKWMIFPKGDLQKLDRCWLALIPLFKNGTLTRLKCSTAKGDDSGVINCYTVDSEDPVDVKYAADCIRECVDYDTIMYYKTNQASALGLYNRLGNKNISKYMHTVKNCMFIKDKFERWKEMYF